MKRFSYGERDYTFGQAMLNLRTAIGLTQAGLAELLGVTRKAVGRWEAGETYPIASHLKALLAEAFGQHAFAAGHEEEEIRAFWHQAHQKALLDEHWLQELLGTKRPRLELVTPQRYKQVMAQQTPGPRVDWGEALAVPSFYGRVEEVAMLQRWVVEERCRVVSVLGLGGIGKSALVVHLMHQVAPHFEVVIWRSLRDATTIDSLLDDCLKVLAPQSLGELSISLEQRLSLLLEHLRRTRVLFVLDNLEAVLAEGMDAGRMRAGYQGYARLLRRVSEAEHQSCLLLTSREKPGDLVSLEGSQEAIRTLRLARLDDDACRQLLARKDVVGSAADYAGLIEAYGGNPLALNIVAQTIVDLFAGQIAPFLEQGEVIFGGIRDLLAQQFTRLSATEQTLLLWLAIVREPVSLEHLLALLVTPLSRAEVLEAIEALYRRSLVERGQHPGSFTLQSVVLEYATGLFIAEAASEIARGQLVRLIEHGLELAMIKEYVRQTQQRLLVAPLLAHVRAVYSGRVAVEAELLSRLDELRTREVDAQGYGPANLLALLREQLGHLGGLDLSRLAMRGAYLQGVEMHDATLAGATLSETVFNEAFDIPWAVAISQNGQYWAAGSRRGEVRVWREEGTILHLAWQAHTDRVRAVAWSPDGRLLASCGFDSTIWLWDSHRSSYRIGLHGHTAGMYALAFTPESRSLLSGSEDGTVRLWEVEHGQCVHILQGYAVSLYDVAWSPDGTRIASSGSDTQATIWEVQGSPSPRLLRGHRSLVFGVAWSPDGRRLASCGLDNAVRLWDATTGETRHVLRDPDHANTLFFDVAWSPDGTQFASASYQHGVHVWEATSGIRRWVSRGQPTRIRRVAWSPDGAQLASCGDDGSVCLWEASDGRLRARLEGHTGMVMSVAWSPDGTRLASAGGDSAGRGELAV